MYICTYIVFKIDFILLAYAVSSKTNADQWLTCSKLKQILCGNPNGNRTFKGQRKCRNKYHTVRILGKYSMI